MNIKDTFYPIIHCKLCCNMIKHKDKEKRRMLNNNPNNHTWNYCRSVETVSFCFPWLAPNDALSSATEEEVDLTEVEARVNKGDCYYICEHDEEGW